MCAFMSAYVSAFGWHMSWPVHACRFGFSNFTVNMWRNQSKVHMRQNRTQQLNDLHPNRFYVVLFDAHVWKQHFWGMFYFVTHIFIVCFILFWYNFCYVTIGSLFSCPVPGSVDISSYIFSCVRLHVTVMCALREQWCLVIFPSSRFTRRHINL